MATRGWGGLRRRGSTHLAHPWEMLSQMTCYHWVLLLRGSKRGGCFILGTFLRKSNLTYGVFLSVLLERPSGHLSL